MIKGLKDAKIVLIGTPELGLQSEEQHSP